MSLPTRQERILGSLAHSLHASEPHLTSMFAIFTRLARDEDMPRLEALDAGSLPFWGWRQQLPRPRRRRRAASGARAAYLPGARLRAILLVPIMLAALAPAVFLGLGGAARAVTRRRPGRSTPNLRRVGTGPSCRCRNDWRANDCQMVDSNASREQPREGMPWAGATGRNPRTLIRPRW